MTHEKQPTITRATSITPDSDLETSYASENDNIEPAATKEKIELARNETIGVTVLRIIVISVLTVAAVLVSTGVYFYAKNDEREAFLAHVQVNSGKIIGSFHERLEHQLNAISTLSNSFTSHAIHNDLSFPFVTLPNFALRAADVRILTDGMAILYFPVITDDDTREVWEKYALKNRFQADIEYENDASMRAEQDQFFFSFQVNEDETTKALDAGGHHREPATEGGGNAGNTSAISNAKRPRDPNVLDDGTNYHVRIWNTEGFTVAPDGTGPYFPVWQRSPVNAKRQKFLNINFRFANRKEFLSNPKALIQRVVSPQGAAIENFKANLLLGQYRGDKEEYVGDPISFILYPVFDSFNSQTRNLGGIIGVNMYWRMLFKNILSSDAIGFVCVVKNSYNQTFSFRMDGDNATFLGSDDFHDPKYDPIGIHTNINKYVADHAGPSTRSYKTVPLDMELGVYTLYVYPSADTEARFSTTKPIMFTLLVSTIFIVTSLVFLLFNFLVERRQRIVLQSAVQSGTIVSSLFPKQVHERLYGETTTTATNDNNDKSSKNWQTRPGHIHNTESLQDENAGASKKDLPIADLFSDTTVFFGDLSGFTKWSSTRTPVDVFNLLEVLYEKFDAIAVRRKVFKVETIGDCYVGVCGLPEPQPDHALRMGKFARDCMHAMDTTVHELTHKLGQDTSALQLRVGLHSGPVTAGVLRGQKSRFQLFGDTVNTASRMESNGLPGRIHVSEDTAKEIRNAGKSQWLIPREDKIVAKGKGELQTYWLNITYSPSVMEKSNHR